MSRFHMWIPLILVISISISESIRYTSKSNRPKTSKAEGLCPLDSSYPEPIPVLGSELYFCTEYKTTACCDEKDAHSIEETVNSLMRKECRSCYQMVKEWKCSQCHPNAGIWYLGDQASIKLCKDYCLAVFEVCKDIPFSVYYKPFYINDKKSKTAEEWCRGITAEDGECFRGNIPQTLDYNCKCEDHNCHKNVKLEL